MDKESDRNRSVQSEKPSSTTTNATNTRMSASAALTSFHPNAFNPSTNPNSNITNPSTNDPHINYDPGTNNSNNTFYPKSTNDHNLYEPVFPCESDDFL